MHLIVVYSYLWNKSQVLQSHIRNPGTEFLEHIPLCSCSLGDLHGFWNIQLGSQGILSHLRVNDCKVTVLIFAFWFFFFPFVFGENHRNYRHYRVINFGNVRGWYKNVCVDQSFWTVALDSVRKARERYYWGSMDPYVTQAFSSVQLLSCVQLFKTPWTAACWASLSITNSQSLLKLMSIELVMPSNHLILCHPLLPSIYLNTKKIILTFTC